MSAKSAAELLLDAINRANLVQFSKDELIFGTPTVADRSDVNTQLELTASETSLYYGTVTVFYSRINLLPSFEAAGVLEIDIPGTGIVSSLDVLHRLNTRYALSLVESDIVVEPIEWAGTFPYTYQLKMAPESIAFLGELNIVLKDLDVDLSEVIPITILDGLYVPDLVLGMVQ